MKNSTQVALAVGTSLVGGVITISTWLSQRPSPVTPVAAIPPAVDPASSLLAPLIVGGLVGGLLYALPILIASYRRHPQKLAITVLTIFGGWTAFLWVAALAWSVLAFETPKGEAPRP